MNPNQKFWNEGQQRLRRALENPEDPREAIQSFLSQHAMVHSAGMAGSGLWSFEDEVWQGLTEEGARRIPRNGEHSIAWITWHLARIEDVTMNLLLAGCPQVLNGEGWPERMRIADQSTGNGMEAGAVAALSAGIDLEALRAYRLAVGRRTREVVVERLGPGELREKVRPSRLDQVRAEGAVVEAASGLLDYWGRLTMAGLLLMPPTRHNFVHLNEASRIKQRSRA